jgi:hypothetical protein
MISLILMLPTSGPQPRPPFCMQTQIGGNFPVKRVAHSDYRTVSPYWVLPVYVESIRAVWAVWADDGDRPLLF